MSNEKAKRAEDRKITLRVIFLMKRVLELEARDWVPRRKTQAPKKSDQIQIDARNEEFLVKATRRGNTLNTGPNNPSNMGYQ